MQPNSFSFFNGCCQLLIGILFKLFKFGSMPVAAATRRQAWMAQQKRAAIDLKRKSPDKKLDDIILAIKAKDDRDVSPSTLHGWLKPENAAKIEPSAKRQRPEWCKASKDL
jgi:hypothetical protein